MKKEMKILGKAIETKNLKTISKALNKSTEARDTSKVEISDNARQIFNRDIVGSYYPRNRHQFGIYHNEDIEKTNLSREEWFDAIIELGRRDLLDVRWKLGEDNFYLSDDNLRDSESKYGKLSEIEWDTSNNKILSIGGQNSDINRVENDIYPNSTEWINLAKDIKRIHKEYSNILKLVEDEYDKLNFNSTTTLTDKVQQSVINKLYNGSATPKDLNRLVSTVNKIRKNNKEI